MRVTDTHYFFYRHQFGQWTMRTMIDHNGLEYNCCEQYMMFHKAMLFKDMEIAQRIMYSTDPHSQKKLGRQVKGYTDAEWIKYRFQIVVDANLLKFTQHKALQDRLLATGNKVLVEASPVDSIWGVGLASDDDRILEPSNWNGLNLLGKALMTVRFGLSQGLV